MFSVTSVFFHKLQIELADKMERRLILCCVYSGMDNCMYCLFTCKICFQSKQSFDSCIIGYYLRKQHCLYLIIWKSMCFFKYQQ